jgi:hypothetical protein
VRKAANFSNTPALHYLFYSRFRTISLCRWGELANYSRPQHYANRQSQTLEFLLAIYKNLMIVKARELQHATLAQT